MKIQLFYDYIFGTRALPPEIDERKRAHLSKQSNEAEQQFLKEQELKKYVEVREFFGEFFKLIVIKEKPTTNPESKEETATKIDLNKRREQLADLKFPVWLRAALRYLKNETLEDILYGNHTDPLNTSFNFPTDEGLKEAFAEVENFYGYFPDDKSEEYNKALDKFKTIFKVCNLIEKDQDNELLFDYAYKILVLFTETTKKNETKKSNSGKPNKNELFNKLDNFLELHLGKHKNPLFDVLVNILPKNKPKKIQLPEWQTILHTAGLKVFKLFNMAVDIETVLGRAPKNYDEALDTAKKIKYKNHDQYVELANLCIEYFVPETIFDNCLEVEKNRKKRDNLPDIAIAGEKDFAEYHLVKLPFDDPRAYIIGHITNCCQSMGGHSQRCVVDSVTRENNGNYVLLKAKNKKINTAPFIMKDGVKKINYDKFQIVGVGYAWLSAGGNLTFDSWENLRPEPESKDTQAIVSLLPEFAKQATEKTDIIRVTIGRGGKTPRYWKDQAAITNPEIIKEGFQYNDAMTQTGVYRNKEKHTQLINNFKNELQLDDEIFNTVAKPEFLNSQRDCEKIKLLLSTTVVKSFLQSQDNVNNLLAKLRDFGHEKLLNLEDLFTILPIEQRITLIKQLQKEGLLVLVDNFHLLRHLFYSYSPEHFKEKNQEETEQLKNQKEELCDTLAFTIDPSQLVQLIVANFSTYTDHVADILVALSAEKRTAFLDRLGKNCLQQLLEKKRNLINLLDILELPEQQMHLLHMLGDTEIKKYATYEFTLRDLLRVLKGDAQKLLLTMLGKERLQSIFSAKSNHFSFQFIIELLDSEAQVMLLNIFQQDDLHDFIHTSFSLKETFKKLKNVALKETFFNMLNIRFYQKIETNLDDIALMLQDFSPEKQLEILINLGAEGIRTLFLNKKYDHVEPFKKFSEPVQEKLITLLGIPGFQALDNYRLTDFVAGLNEKMQLKWLEIINRDGLLSIFEQKPASFASFLRDIPEVLQEKMIALLGKAGLAELYNGTGSTEKSRIFSAVKTNKKIIRNIRKLEFFELDDLIHFIHKLYFPSLFEREITADQAQDILNALLKQYPDDIKVAKIYYLKAKIGYDAINTDPAMIFDPNLFDYLEKTYNCLSLNATPENRFESFLANDKVLNYASNLHFNNNDHKDIISWMLNMYLKLAEAYLEKNDFEKAKRRLECTEKLYQYYKNSFDKQFNLEKKTELQTRIALLEQKDENIASSNESIKKSENYHPEFFQPQSEQAAFDQVLYKALTANSNQIKPKEFEKILNDKKTLTTNHPVNLIILAKLAAANNPCVKLSKSEVKKCYEKAKEIIERDASKYTETIKDFVTDARSSQKESLPINHKVKV